MPSLRQIIQASSCFCLALILTHCFGGGSNVIQAVPASSVNANKETPCEERIAQFQYNQWNGFEKPLSTITVNVPNYYCTAIYPNEEARQAKLQALRCQYNPCFAGNNEHASCIDQQSEEVQASCTMPCGLPHQETLSLRNVEGSVSEYHATFPDWGCWSEAERQTQLSKKACELDFCSEACKSGHDNDRAFVLDQVFNRDTQEFGQYVIPDGLCMSSEQLEQAKKDLLCEKDPCKCEIKDPAKVDVTHVVFDRDNQAEETVVIAGGVCMSEAGLQDKRNELSCEYDFCSQACGANRADERNMQYSVYDRNTQNQVAIQIDNGHCLSETELTRKQAEARCQHDPCSCQNLDDRVNINVAYMDGGTESRVEISGGLCMTNPELNNALCTIAPNAEGCTQGQTVNCREVMTITQSDQVDGAPLVCSIARGQGIDAINAGWDTVTEGRMRAGDVWYNTRCVDVTSDNLGELIGRAYGRSHVDPLVEDLSMNRNQMLSHPSCYQSIEFTLDPHQLGGSINNLSRNHRIEHLSINQNGFTEGEKLQCQRYKQANGSWGPWQTKQTGIYSINNDGITPTVIETDFKSQRHGVGRIEQLNPSDIYGSQSIKCDGLTSQDSLTNYYNNPNARMRAVISFYSEKGGLLTRLPISNIQVDQGGICQSSDVEERGPFTVNAKVTAQYTCYPGQ